MKKVYIEIVEDSLNYCIINIGLSVAYGNGVVINHVHLLMQAGNKILSDTLRDFRKLTS